ncbi:GGDEF domain-containing protein [Deinococcus sp.]|uniref:GGDEF domain-containing protein n=1 Tax=Deinococcus sp. TaxID=47478 RepID=UPI0025C44DB0|nr:GGDEF domain-containing protein [Deinococcus sp.]
MPRPRSAAPTPQIHRLREQQYAASVSLPLLSAAVHAGLLWLSLEGDRQGVVSLTGAVLLSVFMVAAALSRRVPLGVLTGAVAYVLPLWLTVQVTVIGVQGRGIPPVFFLSLGVVGLLSLAWLPLNQAAALLLPLTGFILAATLLFNPQDLFLMIYAAFLVALMVLMAQHGQLVSTERARNLRAQHAAQLDPLTGALNRQAGWDTLETATRAPLNAARVAVILTDIDHFGRINDLLRHRAADQVLREFATLLVSMTAPNVSVTRWNGDQFLLILPNVSVAAAHDVADRIVRTARNLNMPDLNGVPVSVGLAFAAETEDLDALIDLAEQRLHRAREGSGKRLA